MNAERTMLKTIEGNCDTAVGGLATINNNLLTLKSELFSVDGKQRFFAKASGKPEAAKEIGVEFRGEESIKEYIKLIHKLQGEYGGERNIQNW